MLDLWRMHVEQMKRDKLQEEIDKRSRAATRLKEMSLAADELDRELHEIRPILSEVDRISVHALKQYEDRIKRYRAVLQRALDSLK